MSGLGMLPGAPEEMGTAVEPLAPRVPEIAGGFLGGSELEPELQRPPAPMPPPPSAVLVWLRDVLQWADSLGSAK